ncbi:hypothetical protein L2475_02175 [Lactobacillus gasseri]|nr:hypothetical protein [Lactobacillus gasseri]
MALSEEEKKIRHREAQRRYNAKRTKKRQEGDKKELEQYERDKKNSMYGNVKSYIRDKATKAQLLEFRDLIAERQKKLSKKS